MERTGYSLLPEARGWGGETLGNGASYPGGKGDPFPSLPGGTHVPSHTATSVARQARMEPCNCQERDGTDGNVEPTNPEDTGSRHPPLVPTNGNPSKNGTTCEKQPTQARRNQPKRKGKSNLPPLPWDEETCVELAQTLLETTQRVNEDEGKKRLREAVPWNVLESLLQHATAWAKKNGTVVDVAVPKGEEAKVVVVGDVHGQYHDLLKLFEIAGWPQVGKTTFVFNGDFVDRGGWGVECMILLLAWYVALPQHVVLNRGNHETKFCISMYGFQAELQAKYPEHCVMLCRKFVAFFSHLPLGVTIASSEDARPATAVFHGGLFRRPKVYRTPRKRKGRAPKRVRLGEQEYFDDEEVLLLGSMDDLRKCSKGGTDPDGIGHKAVPADILWSDPGPENGLMENVERGVGLVFGPDITQQFLEDEMLRLIIRSHEGPDARADRVGMKSMASGYTVDHEGPHGKLVTVFSAPDYPQFQHEEEERMNNLAAFAELRAPDVAEPKFVTFAAVKPRPQCPCYYDLGLPGSDVEGPEPGTDGDSDTLQGLLTPPERGSLGASEEVTLLAEDTTQEDAAGRTSVPSSGEGERKCLEHRGTENPILPERNVEVAGISTPPTPLEDGTEWKSSFPSLEDKQSLGQSPREAPFTEPTVSQGTPGEEPLATAKPVHEDAGGFHKDTPVPAPRVNEPFTSLAREGVGLSLGQPFSSAPEGTEENLERETPEQF